MSIETLKERLPEYARDLKLNLSSVVAATELTPQQLWGAVLVAALAARTPAVIAAAEAEARTRLSPEAITAARTANALMAMNNIYYRFLHLVEDDTYRHLPARLRMNALLRPGVEKADFELWCLVASAINGCGSCVAAHERTLRQAGVPQAAIQAGVRIAAVVHATAVTLGTGEPAAVAAV